MAHCNRCNKYMLIASISGYCKNCEELIRAEKKKRDAAEAEQRKREEQNRIEEQNRLKQQVLKKQSEDRFVSVHNTSLDFVIRNDIFFGDSRDLVVSKEGKLPKFSEKDHITYLGVMASIDHSYCTFYFDYDKLDEVVYHFNTYAGEERQDKNFYTASSVNLDFEAVLAGLVDKYGDATRGGYEKEVFKNSKVYEREVATSNDIVSFTVDKSIVWIKKYNGYYVGITLVKGQFRVVDSIGYSMYLDYKFFSEKEYNSMGNARNDL